MKRKLESEVVAVRASAPGLLLWQTVTGLSGMTATVLVAESADKTLRAEGLGRKGERLGSRERQEGARTPPSPGRRGGR